MAYQSPYIDDSGIHIPTYEEIRDDLIAKLKQIFGNDIYIDEDSMDYQMVSIFARKIFDCNCLAQLSYNNRTPITAIGVGLDNAVAFANIRRKEATYSTVNLLITGDVGTVIENGEVSDGNNDWELPDEVTIPDSGQIYVQATCKVPGKIEALPNTISKINTPVFGWLSVNNEYSADTGIDEENDASLRGRFAISSSLPSQTVFEGLIAAVEDVEDVDRVVGYENDTGSTSTSSVPGNIPAGLPAHSVTLVVEGGDDGSVAQTIMAKKTPGCYTNGTTDIVVTSISGNVNHIRFYRPTYNTLYVKVSIVSLQGYTPEYEAKIKDAIVDYIKSLQIGENIYRSVVWSVATSAMLSINSPAFSVQDVQFSSDGVTYSASDVIQDFYEVAQLDSSNVSVEVS